MKVCLVTGGASGIGRATARLAAKSGYKVAVGALASYRDDAEAVVAEIRRSGGEAIAVVADVCKESEVVAMFAEVKSALGPVDGVVNAAGVSYSARPEDYKGDALDLMMRVNITGLILCCREAIRQMDGRGGSIVNISSMAATIGGRPGAAAYAASKAAVDAYTTGAARPDDREAAEHSGSAAADRGIDSNGAHRASRGNRGDCNVAAVGFGDSCHRRAD